MKLKTIFVQTLICCSQLPLGAIVQPDMPREMRRPASFSDNMPERIINKAPEHASYETRLTGFVYYASNWETMSGTTPLGIYTISTEPGSQPQEYGVIGKASSHCSGGAVLASDTYWYIWRQEDPTGAGQYDISQLYSFNIKTKERKDRKSVV